MQNLRDQHGLLCFWPRPHRPSRHRLGHKHSWLRIKALRFDLRAADKGWKDFDHNQAVLNVEQMFSDGAADQRVPLTLVRSTELLGDDNA